MSQSLERSSEDFALALKPEVMVTLKSYRIDNQINASLHYLALGQLSESIASCYSVMVDGHRKGSPYRHSEPSRKKRPSALVILPGF